MPPSPPRDDQTGAERAGAGHWTDERIAHLREWFGVRDDLFLARELGVTREALVAKAWEVFDAPLRTGPWPEGEVDELRRFLGAVEPALIGRMIGRSPEDVDAKLVELARELGDEPFSVDEVAAFKRLYGTRSDEDLALVFGRRIDLVKRTAEELCLSKDKAFLKRHADATKAVKMPRWSHGELGRLTELYPSTPNLEIARELGRSVKSVVSKAHHLGLKKDKARLRQMGQQNVKLRYERYDQAP